MALNLRLTDTVSIATSGTTSTTIALEGNRIPLAIVIPASFEGTAMTFQVSPDNSTFYPLYDESSQYSVTVAPSRHVALKRQAFDGVRYVRLVSGTTVTAARTITVINGQ